MTKERVTPQTGAIPISILPPRFECVLCCLVVRGTNAPLSFDCQVERENRASPCCVAGVVLCFRDIVWNSYV